MLTAIKSPRALPFALAMAMRLPVCDGIGSSHFNWVGGGGA